MKDKILQLNRNPNLSAWFQGQLEYALENQWDLEGIEKTQEGLVKNLAKYRRDHNISNVVLGMSGGIDSTLTATLFDQAGWTVTPVIMPIYQDPEETGRGIEAAQSLVGDGKFIVRDLSFMYDRCINDMTPACHLELANDTDQARKRRGNIRARLRMITLYDLAADQGGLVASTDNFSELAAGFWTLHGDVGDVAPIQSLFKSWEVPMIAESFDTVPSSVVQAKPTDGLGIANGDEDQFGFSYLEFDLVLQGLLNGNDWHTDPELESDLRIIMAVKDRIRSTTFKRANPFNLQHPQDRKRYTGLAKLDKSL